jgi:ABC-2 type transport system permease protein
VAGALMVGLAAMVTVIIGQPLTGAGDVVATAARGVPLVIWASLIGFCAAMLTRHTVAALGVLLGYGLLYIASTILGSLIPTVSRLAPWRLETNIQAFLSYGTDYDVYRRTVTDAGVDYESVSHHLGFGAASAYLAVVLLAVLAVTLLVFRRRDVN